MNNAIYDKHLTTVHRTFYDVATSFRLTINELLYVLSFIANFVIGKIIHFTSEADEVYNYYNDKNNIFNQFFVKKGWFWTTLIIVIFYGCLIIQGKDPKIRNNKTKVIRAAIINYVISTMWWIFFTQWFFGLPLMDKIFVWTGGKCTNIHESKIDTSNSFFTKVENFYESNVITSSACRSLKGHWTGGHDPSGHVFLMIHSSLYMFFEVKQFWVSWAYLFKNFKTLVHDIKTNKNVKSIPPYIINNPSILIILLTSLWWFMLLMTNVYFHSILEKFVGLLFGYCVIGLYIYPRFITSSSTPPTTTSKYD